MAPLEKTAGFGRTALVFSGAAGLAAYQAGAFTALQDARKTDVVFGNQTHLWLAGYRRELMLRQDIVGSKSVRL